MPKKWFGAGEYVQFEDRAFRAPVNYREALKSLYGENYMELPPESKRITRHPEKVIFSDGEEIRFN